MQTPSPREGENAIPFHPEDLSTMNARVDSVLQSTTIIVAVKDDPRVVNCLRSVDEDVEIVLALNGSPDYIREIAATHPKRPRVTEIAEGNLAAAYNSGARASSGNYLLFMDSDCVFAPGTIRYLAAQITVDNPVVKGRVVFTSHESRISRIIEKSRTFQIADHVNAYSPPLLYDKRIVDRIGGYHYADLIHWEEDREFDFRLQLAGIKVKYAPEAIVYHAAQGGWTDLRSGFRYGMGEAIGQELGLFITPAWRWRLRSDLQSILQCVRSKGTTTALYRTVWLAAYHAGTAWHTMRDPYGVRRMYPLGATRVKVAKGVPGHTTKLDEAHIMSLRAAHRSQGRKIGY